MAFYSNLWELKSLVGLTKYFLIKAITLIMAV